ncbi:MAG: FecR domain-containing protein [Treponema sp.]|nr:FecR domain-containing protein [Treponema sp.]
MKYKRIFIIACLFCFCAVASVFAQEAVITAVNGKVERKDFDTWVAVAVGDKLEKGAVISTGFKSTAELSINGATVTIAPLTRATIQQLLDTDSASTTKIALASGKLAADVPPQQNKRVSFKVTSPVATLSVRGTAFSVYADGTFKTERGVVSKLPPESMEEAGEEETVEEVQGGWAGVPVAANQRSTTDAVTGEAVSPQTELVAASQSLGGTTTTLAASESVVSTASALVVSTTDAETDKDAASAEASVTVTLTF